MRYILLSIMLFLSHLGMAQNPTDKLDDTEFKKLVNTIGVYFLRTSAFENEKMDEDILAFEYQTFDEYKKQYPDLIKGNTLSLFNELNALLNENRSDVKRNEYLNGKATKSILNDPAYKSIGAFFKNGTNRTNTYQDNFSTLLIISGVVPNTSTPPPGAHVDTKSKEPKVVEVGFFELKPLSVGLVLGTILGFIGAYLVLKKVGTSDHKEEDSKYKEDRVTSSPVSNDLIKYQDQINELNEENRQLRTQLADLEISKQVIVQTKEQMIEDIVSVPIELKVVAPAPTKSVKYYSIPNQDGIFTTEKSKESSIYTVEYTGNDEGRFYIDISERLLKDAIFEMSTFIDCGCEYIAKPSSSTKSIKVLQTGSVINESGNWRIVEKCKIEFV